MLRFRKNSRLICAALALSASAAQAGIILQDGTMPPPTGAVTLNRSMNSIVLLPSSGVNPETAYLVQRSQAWRTYRRNDPNSGALLVYPPAFGGVGAPSSIRQLEVRNHLSRANAYRLNYFKK